MLVFAGLSVALATVPVATASDHDSVEFVAIGDFGQDNSGQWAVSAAFDAKCDELGCDFVAGVGDNIYYSGVDSVWDDKFRTHFEEPYAAVDLPFYMVFGDHDAEGSKSAQVQYTDRSAKWEMPATYYAHQHGNVLFLALDATVSDFGPQASFVRDQLASTDADWVFAQFHYPLASNGKHGGVDGEARDFIRSELCGNVDVLFSGDDHLLQWLPLDDCGGTEQVVSGAGAAPRSLQDNGYDAYYEKGDTLGFFWGSIDGGTFEGRFYDDDGRRLFTRTLTKDVTGEPEPTPEQGEVTWELDDDIGTNWVEVYLSPDDAAAVDVRVNGGAWSPLTHRSWGSWATSGVSVPDGASVTFRATYASGASTLSPTYAWPTSQTEPGHAVAWELDDDIGTNWVEVYPTSDAAITKVDVNVDGTWSDLGAKSWGSWARSMPVAEGASVTFRATFSDGTATLSRTWSWLVDTEPSHVPPSSGDATSGSTVAWELDDDVGRYWVEVYLTTEGAVSGVDVRVDGGAWTALSAKAWGSWARSLHVPAGAEVTFRATFDDGATATSGSYTWP